MARDKDNAAGEEESPFAQSSPIRGGEPITDHKGRLCPRRAPNVGDQVPKQGHTWWSAAFG
ncbi:hypothetical protein STXM2123_1633 [Streptomyces sp. F-3]|nr:hypothetical protein STXM2123_1633 [Streptomyces sp. F-3]